MTKAQARQRIWANVSAFLELELKGDSMWLSHSRAPECRLLSERDQKRMKEAAEEVLKELRARASEM